MLTAILLFRFGFLPTGGLRVALSRHARPVHHLFEVGQVLSTVAALRGHARALLRPTVGLPCPRLFNCFIIPVGEPVFLLSGRGLLFGGRLLHFEGRWELALLDEALL